MSKKVRRVPVVLDAGEIKDLPQEDIQMILRGTDELISTGGRSMLAKMLKGSKDKKMSILDFGWDFTNLWILLFFCI